MRGDTECGLGDDGAEILCVLSGGSGNAWDLWCTTVDGSGRGGVGGLCVGTGEVVLVAVGEGAVC